MKDRAYGRETKYQRVLSELEALANRLGPEGRLPPVRDLAASLGVSLNTLAGALQELEQQDIIQRRQGVGVFVSPSRPKSIWLICNPRFFALGHSPFWEVLIDEAHLRASERQENLSMHFTLPRGEMDVTLHQILKDEISGGRVQGVIGIGLDWNVGEWIMKQGVAYTAYAGWAPYAVSQDYEAMIELGVKGLVERGCRRLSLWQPRAPEPGVEPGPIFEKHSAVFVRTVRAHGLDVDEKLLKQSHHLASQARPESCRQQGYRTAMEVFDGEEEWPDGILVMDDTMMQGGLLAMAKLGVRPGRDVLVASHANKGTSVLLGSEDDIMRLEYDPVELVQNLFDILETLMAGRVPDRMTQIHAGSWMRLAKPELALPTRK